MHISPKFPRSLTFLISMTVLLGVVYPAFVTVIAQLAFPAKANGSLIVQGGKVRGSSLLAQKFERPSFFHARPSATDYAYIGSGASNLGPTSADLAKSVAERKAAWEAAYGAPAPQEMLYASGSGLDPDISLEAALAQEGKVATARGLGEASRQALAAAINAAAAKAESLIGPKRVNVVELNALLESDPRFKGTGE
jgi:K+-transporting ATPase ATPase C chain